MSNYPLVPVDDNLLPRLCVSKPNWYQSIIPKTIYEDYAAGNLIIVDGIATFLYGWKVQSMRVGMLNKTFSR